MINATENDEATICCDNQGTISIAKNPIYHRSANNVDIR